MHVTLRSAFRPLRTQYVFPTLKGAIAQANQRHRQVFRVVHYSVQADHLHLLVEAADKQALSAGMKGLAVRIARRVNGLVFRRGRFWADRWHGRALTSPRATRNALAYVLGNFRKPERRARAAIDTFSSAPFFSGFREYRGRTPIDNARRASPGGQGVGQSTGPDVPGLKVHPPWGEHAPRGGLPIVVPPLTWLLSRGWKKLGELSVFDGPAPD